jgi:hypothetical protein
MHTTIKTICISLALAYTTHALDVHALMRAQSHVQAQPMPAFMHANISGNVNSTTKEDTNRSLLESTAKEDTEITQYPYDATTSTEEKKKTTSDSKIEYVFFVVLTIGVLLGGVRIYKKRTSI